MAKILVVANARSPLGATRGLAGLAGGHSVGWVSPHAGELPAEVPLYVPKSWARSSVIMRTLCMPFVLHNALRSFQPDLIHVHYAFQGLMPFLLVRQKKPLVVTVMGGDVLPEQGCRFLYKYLTKQLLSRADAVTSKTAFLDQAVRRLVPDVRRIVRISWGVNSAIFHAGRQVSTLREELRLPEAALVVFDPRAAQPLYNKHVIMMAFAKVRRERPELPLYLLASEFAADPAYLKRLKTLAQELQIADRVRFLPKLPPAGMADCYNLAVATVVVPSSEGFPQTLYEALACGSFLIHGDLPQYQEAIDNGAVTGKVCLNDVDGLAGVLLDVVTNPRLRDGAVAAGLAYVKSFADGAEEIRKINALYADCIAHPRQNSLNRRSQSSRSGS